MLKKIIFSLLPVLLFSAADAQKNLLRSGPMTGYSEMREVMLWVQTTESAEVKIKYANKRNPAEFYWTNTVQTSKNEAFTAHLLADSLLPGMEYKYDLYINDIKINLDYECRFETLPLWRWRNDPPAFSFVAGSGTYVNEAIFDRPGKGYGGEYKIFQKIADKSPDFMIWLGDNNYLREPDWNTRTGIQYRNTHSRSMEEMQPLLAKTHNYAIWDDHDYGPNNSDKSFFMKDVSLEVFKQFWANPSYGTKEMPGAITFFNWNDCDFFMLDNRFYRDADLMPGENKTMLGKKQKEWLLNALSSSIAKIKFVVMGGQFLNDSKLYETYSNYGFNKEREEIIQFIQNQDIKNVVFITGDRHHSEINILKEKGKPTIYDITSSSLTSSPARVNPDEKNSYRINKTYIHGKRNFAMIKVSGKAEQRHIEVIFYDADGKEIVRYGIDTEN